jgi:regulator of protease activity HflC (stomatin/prohibitin superfamily)
LRTGEDIVMQESEIHVYARQLWKARGQKAIAEAAHKATEFEEKRDAEQATRWRRIEEILMQIRGPNQS